MHRRYSVFPVLPHPSMCVSSPCVILSLRSQEFRDLINVDRTDEGLEYCGHAGSQEHGTDFEGVAGVRNRQQRIKAIWSRCPLSLALSAPFEMK